MVSGAYGVGHMWAIMVLVLIAWVASGLADSYGVPFAFIVFVAIFGSAAELTSLVSIVVYYKESKALEEAGSDWVPVWWRRIRTESGGRRSSQWMVVCRARCRR
jgi:hypothetical protein